MVITSDGFWHHKVRLSLLHVHAREWRSGIMGTDSAFHGYFQGLLYLRFYGRVLLASVVVLFIVNHRPVFPSVQSVRL